MLLAFDVGNSNIKLGLLDGKKGIAGKVYDKMRISSKVQRSADEYYLITEQFLKRNQCSWPTVEGIISSSVVPVISAELAIFFEQYSSKPYLTLGPGTQTGLTICTEYPHELGADLIANAVGACYLSQGSPCIAVAFGTATTFTVINGQRELLGTAIAPGVETALASLVENTALLRQVKLEMPQSPIGHNTQESIHAGLILGTLGAVEYLIQQQLAVLHKKNESSQVKIYSTGFFGQFYQQHSNYLGEFQENLLFLGLQQIWCRN